MKNGQIIGYATEVNVLPTEKLVVLSLIAVVG